MALFLRQCRISGTTRIQYFINGSTHQAPLARNFHASTSVGRRSTDDHLDTIIGMSSTPKQQSSLLEGITIKEGNWQGQSAEKTLQQLVEEGDFDDDFFEFDSEDERLMKEMENEETEGNNGHNHLADGASQVLSDASFVLKMDPDVRKALGAPIDVKEPFEESLLTDQGESVCEYKFHAVGSKRRGTCRLVVGFDKSLEEEDIRCLQVELPDGSLLDLGVAEGDGEETTLMNEKGIEEGVLVGDDNKKGKA